MRNQNSGGPSPGSSPANRRPEVPAQRLLPCLRRGRLLRWVPCQAPETEPSCKTKPIRPERQERTWTGEAGGAGAGIDGTNKANLPAWTEMGAGGRRCPGRRRWGSLCQTNPICPPRPEETLAAGVTSPADPGLQRAKRSQFPAGGQERASRQGRSCRHGRAETCETKPIVAEVAWTASAL
jgi:hypothetical protein